MNALVLSDLHLEFGPFSPPIGGYDLVILAGDTAPGVKGLTWARQAFPESKIIYLAGNHEYYGHALPGLTDKLTATAVELGIHFLENSEVVIGGTTFFGCTLWSDFQLHGDQPPAVAVASASLNDYRKIRVAPEYRKFRPSDAAGLHTRSRRWLEHCITEGRTQNAVIITHHAPSIQSLAMVQHDDPASAAYASHLDEMVERSAARLWIHGHTHSCVDYHIGATRILSNQRGYVPEIVAGFDAGLTVHI